MRKKKIKPIPKDKKCKCGKKIRNHHWKCHSCWKRDKKTGYLKHKATKEATQWVKRKKKQEKNQN